MLDCHAHGTCYRPPTVPKRTTMDRPLSAAPHAMHPAMARAYANSLDHSEDRPHAPQLIVAPWQASTCANGLCLTLRSDPVAI